MKSRSVINMNRAYAMLNINVRRFYAAYFSDGSITMSTIGKKGSQCPSRAATIKYAGVYSSPRGLDFKIRKIVDTLWL